MSNPQSIFNYIDEKYTEDGYEVGENQVFIATDAPPGSPEKLEVLRLRVERGFPLWHDADRNDFHGIVEIATRSESLRQTRIREKQLGR